MAALGLYHIHLRADWLGHPGRQITLSAPGGSGDAEDAANGAGKPRLDEPSQPGDVLRAKMRIVETRPECTQFVDECKCRTHYASPPGKSQPAFDPAIPARTV